MRIQRELSIVYLDPSLEELVELMESRPSNLRMVQTENHIGIASGYGSTHDHIYRALWTGMQDTSSGLDYILVLSSEGEFDTAQWAMHPGFSYEESVEGIDYWTGWEELFPNAQILFEDIRKVWTAVEEERQRRFPRKKKNPCRSRACAT